MSCPRPSQSWCQSDCPQAFSWLLDYSLTDQVNRTILIGDLRKLYLYDSIEMFFFESFCSNINSIKSLTFTKPSKK